MALNKKYYKIYKNEKGEYTYRTYRQVFKNSRHILLESVKNPTETWVITFDKEYDRDVVVSRMEDAIEVSKSNEDAEVWYHGKQDIDVFLANLYPANARAEVGAALWEVNFELDKLDSIEEHSRKIEGLLKRKKELQERYKQLSANKS